MWDPSYKDPKIRSPNFQKLPDSETLGGETSLQENAGALREERKPVEERVGLICPMLHSGANVPWLQLREASGGLRGEFTEVLCRAYKSVAFGYILGIYGFCTCAVEAESRRPAHHQSVPKDKGHIYIYIWFIFSDTVYSHSRNMEPVVHRQQTPAQRS